MNTQTRSWKAWLLPPLVSLGMAFGALIGMSLSSDAARQPGPPGDMAGAAGALLLIICFMISVVLSLLTVILAKVLHRPTPEKLILRIFVSIVGGCVIGTVGQSTGMAAIISTWLLILGLPFLASWSWASPIVRASR